MDALERLDLMDQLDELIISGESATGLDKLDILDQIDEVMLKLGFSGAEPQPQPEPTPEPEPVPEPEPEPQELPQIVQDFKDEKYKGMAARQFTDMLNQLRDYIGGAISFTEVLAGADEWYRTSTYFEG
ncbi:TPA: hypothetical protein JG832_002479 [Enterobacter hormaechei subsp. xiangfangensis]|nr:hypothetical protein [Enterobacter hormaechei subsp. xiangfangensis]HAV1890614.1 hypothetical protein [Enterobacter hormaechei subsp. xiangfangensis]